MKRPYDLVVFDWEGTIADTLGVILHVVVSEAALLGFGNFNLNQVRKYVDLGLVEFFAARLSTPFCISATSIIASCANNAALSSFRYLSNTWRTRINCSIA